MNVLFLKTPHPSRCPDLLSTFFTDNLNKFVKRRGRFNHNSRAVQLGPSSRDMRYSRRSGRRLYERTIFEAIRGTSTMRHGNATETIVASLSYGFPICASTGLRIFWHYHPLPPPAYSRTMSRPHHNLSSLKTADAEFLNVKHSTRYNTESPRGARATTDDLSKIREASAAQALHAAHAFISDLNSST